MTPTQLLPLANLANFDATAFAATPVSPATQKLAAAFADLLNESVRNGQLPEFPIGEQLPAGGNALPLSTGTTSPFTTETLDPEAIVASLNRDLENLVDDGAFLAPELDANESAGPADLLPESETSLIAPYPELVLPDAELNVALPETPRVTVEVQPEIKPAADISDLQRLPPAPETPMLGAAAAPPAAVVPAQVLPAIPAPVLRQAAPSRLPLSPAPTTPPADGRTPRPVVSADIGPVPIDAGLDSSELPDQALTATRAELATLRGDVAGAQSFGAGPQVTTTESGAGNNILAALSRGAPGTTPPVQQAPLTTSVPLGSIDMPVQQAGWDKAMSERIVMMAGNRIQNAEIRLTPAELGPIRVQLSLDDSAANVTFSAQHALTRDAIEQAMPRLRELLAETGLTLGQANVEDGSVESGSRNANDHSEGGVAAAGDDTTGDGLDEELLPRTRSTDGLVDTFV